VVEAARDNHGMSEDSQIVVPDSFVALFVEPGRHRPGASRAEIAARYEVCEDMATMLTDPARNILWQLGIHESDVLERIHAGLQAPGSGFAPAEAQWVTRRLAEILGWDCGPIAPAV
jgi:hypothetical protein